MVEVFKTNVQSDEDAEKLLLMIHNTLPGYRANFDLEDCDRILRVVHAKAVNAQQLIHLVSKEGFFAEPLP